MRNILGGKSSKKTNQRGEELYRKKWLGVILTATQREMVQFLISWAMAPVRS